MTEIEIIDDQAQRARLAHRTDVLDKVKSLATLPGHGFATTEQVAAFVEAPVESVRAVVNDHREELESNGYRALRGRELRELKGKLPEATGLRFVSQLAVWDRKAVLNLCMLLRDSLVARAVRAYLLAAEEVVHEAATTGATIDQTAIAAAVATALAREMAPYLGAISGRLDGLKDEIDDLKTRMKSQRRPVPTAASLASIMGLPMRRNNKPLMTGVGRDGKPWAAYGTGNEREWVKDRQGVIDAYKLYASTVY